MKAEILNKETTNTFFILLSMYLIFKAVSSSFTTSFLILCISFFNPSNLCSISRFFWIFSIIFFSDVISFRIICFCDSKLLSLFSSRVIFSLSSFLYFKVEIASFFSSILSSRESSEFCKERRVFSCSLISFSFLKNFSFFIPFKI